MVTSKAALLTAGLALAATGSAAPPGQEPTRVNSVINGVFKTGLFDAKTKHATVTDAAATATTTVYGPVRAANSTSTRTWRGRVPLHKYKYPNSTLPGQQNRTNNNNNINLPYQASNSTISISVGSKFRPVTTAAVDGRGPPSTVTSTAASERPAGEITILPIETSCTDEHTTSTGTLTSTATAAADLATWFTDNTEQDRDRDHDHDKRDISKPLSMEEFRALPAAERDAIIDRFWADRAAEERLFAAEFAALSRVEQDAVIVANLARWKGKGEVEVEGLVEVEQAEGENRNQNQKRDLIWPEEFFGKKWWKDNLDRDPPHTPVTTG